MRSFSKVSPSVKLAEGKVLVFVILRENAKTVLLLLLLLLLLLMMMMMAACYLEH